MMPPSIPEPSRARTLMEERVFSDKYQVQEQVAQGTMGIVYKALDQKLNRVVALKVVHPHLTSDASFLQRFLREARSMARLQHENIVTIFSVEQDQGTQFVVMEYFPGTNLHHRIQTNPSFTLSETLSITQQMAKALACAHTHGIVHRDVKPANVLVGTDNRIKLTDFGIAAALDEAPLTSAGQLIGTLLYMSPEQARDATLDGRSDLYSLGLMFYEMLTGTHPRRHLSNTAILGMLATEEKALPLSFPPSIPAEVQALVSDLLRYRPMDRVADADQLVRRLEGLQGTGRPIPPSRPQRESLNLIANDATICELGEPATATSTQKPPKPSTGNRRSVPLLPIATAMVIGAVALYTLGQFTSTSSSERGVSPTQPASTQESVQAPQGPTQPPSPPAPEPMITAVQPPRSITPSPAPPQSKPPTQVVTEPVSTKTSDTPALMRQDQRVIGLLKQLQQAVVTKNLAALDRISIMSEDRRNMVETLFSNYSTIDASLGEISDTSTGVTAFLRIEKLVLPNGELFPAGASLQKIRLTVPRASDGWEQIRW